MGDTTTISRLGQSDEYTSRLADLDRYAAVPRCWNCVHLREIETPGQLFRKPTRRYACGQARPDFLSGGVRYNTDAEEMRASGPCGPSGTLWQQGR